MNTIGIVTPSFNNARFLQQAIDSVQVREPARLRYAIVDGGSRDGSREIIRLNQDRFTLAVLETNHFPAAALNAALARLGGDILGCLSSQDRFFPGALDHVLRIFDSRPYVDVLLGGVRIIDEFDAVKSRRRMPEVFDVERFLHKSRHGKQPATFFRRSVFEAIGGFHPDNRTSWEGELVVDLHLHGARVSYTDVLLSDCRICRIRKNSGAKSKSLDDRNEREFERMRQKAVAFGYPGLSRWRAHLEHLQYKMDFVRHLSYFFLGDVSAQ